MGDIFSPQPMKQPQNKANDQFANILKAYMGGGRPKKMVGMQGWTPQYEEYGPDTLAGFIEQTFGLPAYEGQMTAGPNGMQTAAAGYGQGAMDKFFGAGGDMEAISTALREVLGGGGSNGQAPMDIGSIYAALDSQRRQGLTRDLGDLQEQFGASGIGNSTSAFESAARRQTESEDNLMAEVSRIAPDLVNAFTARDAGRTSAAQALAMLPMSVAQGGFNLGEGMRSIEQGGLDRLYNDFLRQNSLFPQILSYLSGAPPVQYAPSMFQNLTSAGMTAAGIKTAFG